jgi:hypothetical protein
MQWPRKERRVSLFSKQPLSLLIRSRHQPGPPHVFGAGWGDLCAFYDFSGWDEMSTLQRAQSCTKSLQYRTNGGRSFFSTMIELATMLVNR